MADPLSIVAGTVGIIDVCVRLVSYLRNVNAATGKIEQDLFDLIEEFVALEAVNRSIRDTWLNHHKTADQEGPDELSLKTQWQYLDSALRSCKKSILKFGYLIEEIIGRDGHPVTSKLDGIKKVLRKQSKGKEIVEIRQQIMSHRDNLQVLLLALNLYVLNS